MGEEKKEKEKEKVEIDKSEHSPTCLPTYQRNYIFPPILSDFEHEFGKEKKMGAMTNASNHLKDALIDGQLIQGEKRNWNWKENPRENENRSILRPASFAMQYYLLLQRNLLCARRSYVSI